jgi:hypothetical protein
LSWFLLKFLHRCNLSEFFQLLDFHLRI